MSNGGSYDPHAVEPEIYKFWEEGGCFHAVPDPDRKPYVIDIPLPNVTGSLHLGHALNNTLQDLLIRYKRMCGYNAMWMPGTDHAGIATQAVVEKRLREEEGLTRHEVGRDGLVERIWAWKEKFGGQILEQLRRIGCSCDWDRTRFTLDDVCARAVYEVFFQWFKDGLIYRGLRLVNWDAHLQTAVADDEIVHATVQGHLWHYRYPIMGSVGVSPAEGGIEGSRDQGIKEAVAAAAGPDAELGRDYLVIATTRPETMLGDTAVAVHPDDERYQHLIGKKCILPLMDRTIPIIADDILVDPEFGTGCVKVTPGHDPNDYEFAERHGVEKIKILTPDGKINENGGKYAGLDRYDARRKVVEDLEALGLMEKVEPYETEIGHSDRSKTPIEPMLSEQWFVKMPELCELAMEAVRDGRVRFFPKRYEQMYLDWLGEKRDWCISRQLWWGHRIPVWKQPIFPLGGPPAHFDSRHWASLKLKDFGLSTEQEEALDLQVWPHPADGALYALACVKPGNTAIEAKLEGAGFVRDPDVLDTWFSSALWPFSTLGWPDNYGRERGTGSGEQGQTDLDYFFPTSTLVTARGIITLWVARMVMTALYFTKRVPFEHVYIHPIIQDGLGRTMSKSLGNGVDPLDIIELYGTDAMRFTLAQMATETQDVRMPVKPVQLPDGRTVNSSEKFELGRNFCNKVWQAATGFVIPNVAAGGSPADERDEAAKARRHEGTTAAGRRTGRPGDTGVSPVNHRRGGGDTHGQWPRPLKPADLAIEDHWILSRLCGCIEEVNRRFERYQINEAANALYAFFWGEFCDWYVELVKPRLFGRNEAGEMVRHHDDSARVARQVLAWVLDQSLRLLHPIIPFVTEELWRRLNEAAPQRGIQEIRSVGPPRPTRDGKTISSALIMADWPDASAWTRAEDIERQMQALRDVIRALREIRTHVNRIRSAAKQGSIRSLPRAAVKAEAGLAQSLRAREAMIHRLGQCEEIEIGPDVAKPPESASKVLSGIEVYVPLAGLADLEIERRRLRKERYEIDTQIRRVEAKLANDNFVSKAPTAVVDRERTRLAELKEKLEAIERNLAEVSG